MRRFLIGLLGLFACTQVAPPPSPPSQAGATPAVETFAEEIARFEEADRIAPPRPGSVLFVGSSSIRLWPALAGDFPGVYTLQRGFGGAELRDVIRYAPRIVLPYRPRVIVLYAGENDLAAGKSAITVFREYQAFVALVRRTLPETKIVFVSIKPSPSRWALADQMREANDLIRRYAATDPRLSVVDVFTPMLGSDGKPREDLFVEDRLHMNERGYQIWKDLLRASLEELQGVPF